MKRTILRNYLLTAIMLLICVGKIAAQTTAVQETSSVNGFVETLAQARAKTSAKEWDAAAALWEKVVKQNPVEGRFWNQLATVYYNQKNYARANENYKKVIELGGSSPASFYNGNNPAIVTSEKTGELFNSSPTGASYNIACSYALLGDKEQALKWLEKSIDMGFPDLSHVQTDTDLKTLHDDSRFKELVGLTDTSKMSRVEGWRYDLQFLAREVKRKAYPTFLKISGKEFDTAVKVLHDAIPKLTDTQIALSMAKLMRMVGDGHTAFYWGAGPESLLMQFYFFEEGLFIISADLKYKDLLGAQVLKFGDRATNEVVQTLDPLIPRDNQIWIKQVAPYRMRSLPLLNALGLIPDAKKVSLTVRGVDGKERAVMLDADLAKPNIWNTLPNPPEWINLPQTLPAPVPLYLKNMGTSYWFEYLPENKTIYFQFNLIRNDKKESLVDFSNRLFKFINETEVEKLVIDIRWNNGGNNALLPPLVQGLVRNEKINKRGKLFIIIGRRTFSAAQNAATFFERHTNAIFVGEPTGSSPNYVGEEDSVKLPYSKIGINVSDLFWQSSYPHDKRIWIAPQIYLPPTFEAYRTNRDAALEAIINYQEKTN